MKFRGLHAIIAVAAFGAGGFSLCLVARQERQKVLAGLPPSPDVSRWPPALRDRLLNIGNRLKHSPSKEVIGELALIYFANGYHAEAAICLRRLIEEDKDNARWPYLLGLLEKRAGNREAAADWFAKAAQLQPASATIFLHWADQSALLGRFEVAELAFEKGLSLDPDSPGALYGLAKLEYARGEIMAALNRLKHLLDRHPGNQEGRIMLADLLVKMGKSQEVAEHRGLTGSDRVSPLETDHFLEETYSYCFDGHRLLLLGELRNQAGEFATALPLILRARELDPGDTDIHDALARTYVGLKQWAEAEKTLRAALTKAERSGVLYVRLAQILISQRRASEAVVLLMQAADAERNTAAVQNALGLAYLASEQYSAAMAAFERAIQLDALFVDAQFNLAVCNLRSGDPARARSWVEKALIQRPENLEGLALLVSSTLQMRDVEGALLASEELERRGGIKGYPVVYSTALFHAGNAAAQRGDHEKAEHLYQRALRASPNDAQLHGALGMLYAKLQQYEKAQYELKAFVRLAPQNPLGYLLLGTLFDSQKKTVEARSYWEKGLSVAIDAQDEVRAAQLRKLIGK